MRSLVHVVDFGDGEPIAVGETTTLGEQLITGMDYVPAPDPFMVLLTAVNFAKELADLGRTPDQVTHAVLKAIDVQADRVNPVGAYVSFDPIPTVGEVQEQGLSPEQIDELVSSIAYVRVR